MGSSLMAILMSKLGNPYFSGERYFMALTKMSEKSICLWRCCVKGRSSFQRIRSAGQLKPSTHKKWLLFCRKRQPALHREGGREERERERERERREGGREGGRERK
jgi:hypothetical protein